MTIDRYVIIVRDEGKNITHEIPISPQALRDAFEYNARAIWLYIDAYLQAFKKQ